MTHSRLYPVHATCSAWLLLLSLLLSASPAAAETLEKALDDALPSGGLVVYVGPSDGHIEHTLAKTGRYLVHTLAADAAARDRLHKALIPTGSYGLTSVMQWRDRTRLPYADRLVNLLIVDAVALGGAAPLGEEMQRVLAPGGTLLLHTADGWTAREQPRPDAMDDWGHFDHGPDGNALSQDTLVAPIAQPQWITQVMPTPFEGNPAGYDPGGGIRIWRHFAVLDVNNPADRDNAGDLRTRETWELQGRDAFNGVPLWSVKREARAARARWSLVAAEGEVYCWLEGDGELTALDIATGETLRTYSGTRPARGIQEEQQVVRVAGDTLLVGLAEKMVCFDRESAEIRWEYAREGKVLLGPVIDGPRGRVYAVVGELLPRMTFANRWPANKQASAVIALDLANGKLVWENTDVASRPVTGRKGRPTRRGVGQLVPADDHLIVYGSDAVEFAGSPYIASLAVDTGKLVHQSDSPYESKYNVSSYNVLVRDGKAYLAGSFTNMWSYDPATGDVERVLTDDWNQRCTRFTATPNYFLFGQAAYYTPDFDGVQITAARSGCAMGNTPANGMTYFTPNACGCITQMRGFQALAGKADAPPSTPDTQRLTTDSPAPSALTAPADRLPAGPVAADWTRQWRADKLETQPVQAGGLDLVAVIHQHRLEARRDGKVVWSVTADARVSSPPVVMGDIAVFGSHDGSVYGVSLPAGRLEWRYQLAPALRLIGVNGQLENAWPVFGVAAAGDQVIASAGTHAELHAGVSVAALDPATGRPAWTRHLIKESATIPKGGKGATIVDHSFINSSPRITVTPDGLEITLGDGGRKGGSFTFSPAESDQTLHARLNTQPTPEARD